MKTSVLDRILSQLNSRFPSQTAPTSSFWETLAEITSTYHLIFHGSLRERIFAIRIGTTSPSTAAQLQDGALGSTTLGYSGGAGFDQTRQVSCCRRSSFQS